MKYLPLIWAGIWRKRSRAVLMLLQIASAFLLFGLLQGVNSGIKEVLARTHSDRLYVGSAVSLGVPLPISMLPRLKAVPGVKVVQSGLEILRQGDGNAFVSGFCMLARQRIELHDDRRNDSRKTRHVIARKGERHHEGGELANQFPPRRRA